jgi:hypothetical protein
MVQFVIVDALKKMLFFKEIDATKRFADCTELYNSRSKDLGVTINVI